MTAVEPTTGAVGIHTAVKGVRLLANLADGSDNDISNGLRIITSAYDVADGITALSAPIDQPGRGWYEPGAKGPHARRAQRAQADPAHSPDPVVVAGIATALASGAPPVVGGGDALLPHVSGARPVSGFVNPPSGRLHARANLRGGLYERWRETLRWREDSRQRKETKTRSCWRCGRSLRPCSMGSAGSLRSGAAWVVPCPVPQRELRGFARCRGRVSEQVADRTRQRIAWPVLQATTLAVRASTKRRHVGHDSALIISATAYLSHVLDGCGFPPRMIRSTRLVDLVNTMDPKLVAAAFGMDPQAALIYLGDRAEPSRLAVPSLNSRSSSEEAWR